MNARTLLLNPMINFSLLKNIIFLGFYEHKVLKLNHFNLISKRPKFRVLQWSKSLANTSKYNSTLNWPIKIGPVRLQTNLASFISRGTRQTQHGRVLHGEFFWSHNFFIQILNWTFCICSFDQLDERNTMVKFILHFDYFDKPDPPHEKHNGKLDYFLRKLLDNFGCQRIDIDIWI